MLGEKKYSRRQLLGWGMAGFLGYLAADGLVSYLRKPNNQQISKQFFSEVSQQIFYSSLSENKIMLPILSPDKKGFLCVGIYDPEKEQICLKRIASNGIGLKRTVQKESNPMQELEAKICMSATAHLLFKQKDDMGVRPSLESISAARTDYKAPPKQIIRVPTRVTLASEEYTSEPEPLPPVEEKDFLVCAYLHRIPSLFALNPVYDLKDKKFDPAIENTPSVQSLRSDYNQKIDTLTKNYRKFEAERIKNGLRCTTGILEILLELGHLQHGDIEIDSRNLLIPRSGKIEKSIAMACLEYVFSYLAPVTENDFDVMAACFNAVYAAKRLEIEANKVQISRTGKGFLTDEQITANLNRRNSLRHANEKLSQQTSAYERNLRDRMMNNRINELLKMHQNIEQHMKDWDDRVRDRIENYNKGYRES